MKRLTFKDSNDRTHFTVSGHKMYCSTQATADTIAKYEELLESLGFNFEDNTADIFETVSIRKDVGAEINM